MYRINDVCLEELWGLQGQRQKHSLLGCSGQPYTGRYLVLREARWFFIFKVYFSI